LATPKRATTSQNGTIETPDVIDNAELTTATLPRVRFMVVFHCKQTSRRFIFRRLIPIELLSSAVIRRLNFVERRRLPPKSID
jgi:hypothetical protein